MAITDHKPRAGDRRSRQDLRRLSGNMVDAREEERQRIARELHDELGQRLSALKIELTGLGQELHGRSSQLRLNAMLEMLDETMASVRRIASDLRPLMLDDLGLAAAIAWLASESGRRMGIKIDLQLVEGQPLLNPRASTALYRMVQEALTNVARHAQATAVRIDLHAQEGEMTLTVQDNGIGFPPIAARKKDSCGLLGMRERALLLGGQVRVDNPPAGGGRITVRLPLQGNLLEPLSPQPESQEQAR